MKMYEAPRNEIEAVEGNTLRLATDSKRFVRNVSGTSLAGILGLSPWDTRFTAQCKLLGMCDEDISQKPAIIAGRALEEVIIAHSRHLGVLPAEEVFEPRVGDHDEWSSDFEDPDFVGHLDGMTEDGMKVVEVKTTIRPEDWVNGPPMHYWLQASLYAHFMGVDDIMFLVGILTEEDRAHPMQWDPEGHVYKVEVKKHPQIQEFIDEARAIRRALVNKEVNELVATDDPRDQELISYFRALNADGAATYKTLGDLEMVEKQIAEIEEAQGLKALYDRRDELRDSLKTEMMSQKLEEVEYGTIKYKLSQSARKSLDKAKMVESGLDPDDYMKTTLTYTLRRN